MAKILIVDDEQDLCVEFSKILETEKHEVDYALEGEAALQKTGLTRYDVVFLDVLMPRMEGREVLEAIRAQSPKTAVVIISGYLSPDKEKEALKLGAVACLKKPFEMKDVKRIIERLSKK